MHEAIDGSMINTQQFEFFQLQRRNLVILFDCLCLVSHPSFEKGQRWAPKAWFFFSSPSRERPLKWVSAQLLNSACLQNADSEELQSLILFCFCFCGICLNIEIRTFLQNNFRKQSKNFLLRIMFRSNSVIHCSFSVRNPFPADMSLCMWSKHMQPFLTTRSMDNRKGRAVKVLLGLKGPITIYFIPFPFKHLPRLWPWSPTGIFLCQCLKISSELPSKARKVALFSQMDYKFSFFKDFINLFERERENEQGEGQREKQTPRCTGRPMQTLGSWP